MKYVVFLILVISTFTIQAQQTDMPDNPELVEIYKQDQADRTGTDIDWLKMSINDSLRRKRVYELLDSNMVHTAGDYQNEAMVFQHGGNPSSYKMAMEMMEKAIELDPSTSKWLLAAATDRYLQSIGKPQIYGTQYVRSDGEQWSQGAYDTTQVTDAQRKEYGVRILAQQSARLKQMNSKQLSELLMEGRSISEIVDFIKAEENTDSGYDISENGINSFGYDLMGDERFEDALVIFKLNTELYPDGWNTYDSLGECLLKMGKQEEGIAAYKKSLELNPNNEFAKRALMGLE